MGYARVDHEKRVDVMEEIDLIGINKYVFTR